MDLSERSEVLARCHPWEVARATFLQDVLRPHDRLEAPRWLDIGAGDQCFAEQLVDTLSAGVEGVCWDVNSSDKGLARGSSERGVGLTAERPTGHRDRPVVRCRVAD